MWDWEETLCRDLIWIYCLEKLFKCYDICSFAVIFIIIEILDLRCRSLIRVAQKVMCAKRNCTTLSLNWPEIHIATGPKININISAGRRANTWIHRTEPLTSGEIPLSTKCGEHLYMSVPGVTLGCYMFKVLLVTVDQQVWRQPFVIFEN